MNNWKVEVSVGSYDNVVHTTTVSAKDHCDAMCRAEEIARKYGNDAVWCRAEKLHHFDNVLVFEK